MPVGISFYIFQSLSYTIDVYRSEIDAKKNILRYALFVSFFPQLVAGPIERSRNLLQQIRKTSALSGYHLKRGLLLILYGLFQKIVIADNIAAIIDPVYASYSDYPGCQVILANILFAFQIYCDFNGYSTIAIGSAEMLGYKLMENFDCPYFSSNISEFWKRWHISLGSWFQDYVYIPLGGNRKGRYRTSLNTMTVFFLSGLWHGANWTYVIWGVCNGLFIICEKGLTNYRNLVNKKFSLDKNTYSNRLLHRFITFFIIDFTWLFFRAENLNSASGMLCHIFNSGKWNMIFSDQIFSIFPDTQTVIILCISLFILLSISKLHERKIIWTDFIFSQNIFFRYAFYLGMLLIIIFFGAYGEGYEQTQFIYFQF